MISQIMPSLTIAISLLSAAGYALEGDLRRVIYWLPAAALTASITF